ncbi:related to WD40-repeat protein (notchless protein) [Serendipita indica DSM 11827]|uniref:Related to WD40-repeat protein (Notchless protein) n=1 Tax=Serendipita indica (strain DSM 11827) TaxID=1109443 RepID=G4U139_SERID|nr:related to WD40-repeat protein (notchless protein) [Serendipita indica DSM 11827]
MVSSYNICQLESSFYLNKQIPDLDEKLSKFIPRRLRYASSHWLFHVSGMDDKKPCPLENDVGYILRSPQVLYWMEVLSFMRSVPRAIDGLRVLSDNMALGEKIRWRINDTLRCLIAFLVPIQESAAHIYISALPFMPKRSILRIEGLRKYSETLRVTQGLEEVYPGLPDSLRGHSESVSAVAFSPDGSRIVSGSKDQTIRLWDAKTGEPVGDPLRGHSDRVTAVAISQSDSQLVSGSGDNTVRLWDTDIVLPSNHLFQHRVDQDNATASLPENLAIISGSTSDMGPVSRDAFGRYSLCMLPISMSTHAYH